MSQRQRDRVPPSSRNAGGSPNRPQRRPTPNGRRTEVYAPQQRDPFPYIMGGVIGALVVGLMLVIFLLTNRGTTPTSPPITSGEPTQPVVSGTAPVEGADAPRINMDDFKKLYDSAERPIIIDVRAKTGYDQGHIPGAISFPEAEVDARVNELPKDKLVIAYCA